MTNASSLEAITYREDIERRISEGSVSAMIQYGHDAIRNHAHNHSEIERRMILIQSGPHNFESKVIWTVGIMAAMVNDRHTYDQAILIWGNRIHPLFGYYAYAHAQRADLEKRIPENWIHAVELSARMGAIPARMELAILKYRGKGVLGSIPVSFAIIRFSVLERILRWRNPSDPRLVPMDADPILLP